MSDPDLEYVMLLGEGTFHQVHGGVASNAPINNHPFARLHEEYVGIRGKAFRPVPRRPYLLGQLNDAALPAPAASAANGLRFWQMHAPAQPDLFADP